jgi:hypothetical protein
MPFGVVVAAVVLAGLAVSQQHPGAHQPASIPVPSSPTVQRLPLACPESSGRQTTSSANRLAALIRPPSPTVQRLFWILAAGGPVLLYDLWVAYSHPVLAGWNAQNLTPSPPLWDFLLSFSPVLWLALPGAWSAWRSDNRRRHSLLVWAGLGLLLLYLPSGLQRRFMLGLFIPLAGLAVLGLGQLANARPRRSSALIAAFFLLALPTNLLVLLAAGHGIGTQDAQLYLTRGESQALAWIGRNTPESAVVLAAPDTGLFIPAWTGRRVIYGHPFETVEAAGHAAAVRAYFRGVLQSGGEDLLAEADYVFSGPREQTIGGPPPDGRLRPVYQADGVTIYAVGR